MTSPEIKPVHGRGRSRIFTRVLALVVATALLGGCSSISNLFGNKDEDLPDRPADQLYNEGLYLLNDKHDNKKAAAKFEEVDKEHPYSEWARKALIMSSYAYYNGAMYAESIAAAQRYITLHPGSPDAAYAQYLIGSSYYDEIPDITRDQARTQKALDALDEVIRKYPNTEYANSAKQKLEFARDQLAGREMMIGRYYLERRQFTGAINRFKIVITQYQTTRHVEEALERLTEAYMSLGIVDEAQTAAAVLGHNFPDSPWYKRAYTLVTSGGKTPTENKDSWISKAFRKVGLG